MDSWARFALVLGGGVGGSSESIVNSLTVSSVELDAEGFLTVALGKEIGYQIHSSEDPGKTEKNRFQRRSREDRKEQQDQDLFLSCPFHLRWLG